MYTFETKSSRAVCQSFAKTVLAHAEGKIDSPGYAIFMGACLLAGTPGGYASAYNR
jgi:hypothetical protein